MTNRTRRARLRRALRQGTATVSLVDRLRLKGAIHRNKANRLKSKIARKTVHLRLDSP